MGFCLGVEQAVDLAKEVASKNKDKNISLDELQTYIKDNVSRESSKLGQTKVQEPLLKTTINKQTVIYLKE